MKSYDKLPTDENLDDVAQNDVLGRNRFIADFIRLLASIEGHYSIAIDGRWGSGKTFFVRQTERVIKAYYSNQANQKLRDIEIFKNLFSLNEIISHPMLTFYYDAWQHDNRQDALLSFVFEIAKNASSINPKSGNIKDTKDQLYNGVISAVKGVIDKISGIDLEKIMNDTKEIFQEIQKQEDLEVLLNDFFKKLLPDDTTRLVIFIDELDRCKPDYAVQLLERIKHYVKYDKITFVFSVNTEQLQHIIKRYYGDDFEASSYLDRFFDDHIALPISNFEQRRKIFSWGAHGSIFARWCHLLTEEFKFEMRESYHFYELVEKTLQCHDDSIIPIPRSEEDEYNLPYTFIKAFFVPLGLALRIKNISDYYSFIDGKNKKVLEILSNNFSILSLEIFFEHFGFSKDDYNQELTSQVLNEFLGRLYDAVFGKIYDNNNTSIPVGKLQVNGLIQNKILSLFSSISKKN